MFHVAGVDADKLHLTQEVERLLEKIEYENIHSEKEYEALQDQVNQIAFGSYVYY
jgi:hypothetical protein